jgi:hypothetical protein
LNRLAQGAIHTAARLSQDGADVVDAEVVVEGEETGSETFNEPSNEPEVLTIGSEDNGSITFNESLKDDLESTESTVHSPQSTVDPEENLGLPLPKEEI